jgi:hypothetical protein
MFEMEVLRVWDLERLVTTWQQRNGYKINLIGTSIIEEIHLSTLNNMLERGVGEV